MGTLTITMVGDGAFGTKSKTFTIDNAHVNRFNAALIAKYSTPTNTLTSTQALLAWANNVFENAKTDVRDFENRQATAAITPITAT